MQLEFVFLRSFLLKIFFFLSISVPCFSQWEYSDIPLSAIAGFFHGKEEAYRLCEVLSLVGNHKDAQNYNVKWHTAEIPAEGFIMSVPLDIYITDKDWKSMIIRAFGDIIIYNVMLDGIRNNTQHFSWFRQSNDSGWKLEKMLTPTVKVSLLASYILIRVLYTELWGKRS
jgi:hypothetical protein